MNVSYLNDEFYKYLFLLKRSNRLMMGCFILICTETNDYFFVVLLKYGTCKGQSLYAEMVC